MFQLGSVSKNDLDGALWKAHCAWLGHELKFLKKTFEAIDYVEGVAAQPYFAPFRLGAWQQRVVVRPKGFKMKRLAEVGNTVYEIGAGTLAGLRHCFCIVTQFLGKFGHFIFGNEDRRHNGFLGLLLS